MLFRLSKLIFLIFIFFTLSFGEFRDYQQNVYQLRSLLREKEIKRHQLAEVNSDIARLQMENLNWLEKRKLARLNSEKAEINDKIYSLYDNIAGLKEKCYTDFHAVFNDNEMAINRVLRQLDQNSTDSQLTELLTLTEQRDFLVNSQQYFISINEKTLELDIDHRLLADRDSAVREDFAGLLQTKIQNIQKAIETAEKEKLMREKLHDFRQEIAAIHEPETQGMQTALSSGEKGDFYTENGVDNDMINYDKTRGGGESGFDFVYDSHDLINSGNDLLYFLENQDEMTIDNFITKMDSLKNYYRDLLLELDQQ